MALNNKQRIFVEEYLKCFNASEAARRAGYTGAANIVGPRLLSNVGIKQAVEIRIAETVMSADEVLLRLADMARATLADFVSDAGEIDMKAAKRAGKLHLVKSYTVTDKGGQRIELHDAQAALALIGRQHKLFVDKVEHSGKIGMVFSADDAATAEAELSNWRPDATPQS